MHLGKKKLKTDLRFITLIDPIARERAEREKDDPDKLNKMNEELASLHKTNLDMKRSFRKGIFR